MKSLAKHVVRTALRQRVSAILPAVAKSVLKGWVHDPVYPSTLQIEPTRRCNLRCVMCAMTQFYDAGKTSDMTLDEFKRILSQLPRSVGEIWIQGTGEPLANKDIIGMIKYARERNLRTQFNTNLLLLTDEMAERLVEAGHNELIVSIETAHPERYADLRRNGTLDRFLQNLDRLAHAKKRAGAFDPAVTACTILMKHTLPDIPELVRVLKEHGVTHMTAVDLCTYPEYTEPLTLADGSDLREQSLSKNMSRKEIDRVLREIKALADDQFSIFVPGEGSGLKPESACPPGVLTCKELWRIPFVKADGSFCACCWAPQFVMGNIKQQPFEEIWLGDAYRRLRWQHLSNQAPEHCRKCQMRIYPVAKPSRLLGHLELNNEVHEVFF